MAKLKNIRQDHTLPVLGGRFIVKTWRGKLIMQAWPKKRERPLPPKVQAQNQRFANANILAKYAAPDQQNIAMELAKEGPLYPRDYLTAAMTSGLFIYQMGKNHKVYPMSVRNEVSAELDIIAQTPGSLMGRAEDWWEPVTPTGLYQVPAIMDLNGKPVFMPQGPEIGGHQYGAIQKTNTSVSGSASKGWYTEITIPITITHAIPQVEEVFNGQYKCVLCRLSGTTIAEILATSDSFTASATATNRRLFTFANPPVLAAGTRICLLHVRTDSTTTTSSGLWGGTEVASTSIPRGVDLGFIRFASNDPAVNDVANASATTGPFSLDIVYKF